MHTNGEENICWQKAPSLPPLLTSVKVCVVPVAHEVAVLSDEVDSD